VRVDDGFEQGMEIPIYYDPMIAKLITHGKDRKEAIERMIRAIDEYTITGIQTTLGFGKYVMQHPAFISGNFDTHFVSKYFTPDQLQNANEEEAMIAAIIAATFMTAGAGPEVMPVGSASASAWKKNRKEY